MNEDLRDREVLLVKKKDSDELKAVIGMDKYGMQIAHPKQENEPDFLQIDKHGNALENFMSNFFRQMKNPTHFQFFKVPLDKVEEGTKKLQTVLKNPENPANRELLNTHRVETGSFVQKQSTAIDENRLDWKQFERLGINREMLEKTNSLEKLLNWQKTDLLPVTLKFDEVTLRTDARLSLRETSGENLSVSIHALRKEPELNRPYFGVKFTDEDKRNLLTTGHLGRIAEVQYKPGETTPVLISIDRQTNELVSCRADKVKIPETVKGVVLNEEQKKDLSEGKAVYLENMISKKDTEFSAYLQFNADKRSFEFRFDNERRQSQKQDNEPNDVPKTFRKKELNEDQRSSLREGKSIYIDGLTDKKGKAYSGYITLNRETGKTDFMFPKEYREAVAAGKAIADDRVNLSEKPAAKQEQKKPKKAKGMKM